MALKNQGIDPGRYSLIPRTLIFAFHNHEVLLIKGAAHKRLWANLYNGIGGHIERGEDVISAGRREFFEETGLVLDEIYLSGVVLIDTGSSPGIALFVLCGSGPRGNLRASSEGQLHWLPVNEQLYSLPLVKDLKVLLPQVINQSKGEPPFSLLYSYDPNDTLRINKGE